MNNPKYFSKHMLEKFGLQRAGACACVCVRVCCYWIFDLLERYKIEQSAVTDDVAHTISHASGYMHLEAVFFYVFKDK